LLVARRFDVLGQAKYFFISYKGTSITKQNKQQQQSNNINKMYKITTTT